MEKQYERYSLINVMESSGDRISGSWIQNHVGTLESARALAMEIEAVNSNKIDVAVVREVSSPVPALSYWTDLLRLDNGTKSTVRRGRPVGRREDDREGGR